MQGLPDLYLYEDYRKYLRDVYDHLKSIGSDFSFRKFSQMAGFKSTNYLKMVMEGERSLTPESIKKFAKGLKLSKEQRDFFEALVLFNQAKTSKAKAFQFEKLKKIRGYKEVRDLESEEFEVLSKWYFAAVREIADLEDFKEDSQWIAKRARPNLTAPQVEQALELLQKVKMLIRDKKGVLIQSQPSLGTSAELLAVAAKTFHQQMLGLASNSIDEVAPDLRDITGLTIGIDPMDLPAIKKDIFDFRRQLLNKYVSSVKKPKEAYQLAIQLFPLSQNPRKGDKS